MDSSAGDGPEREDRPGFRAPLTELDGPRPDVTLLAGAMRTHPNRPTGLSVAALVAFLSGCSGLDARVPPPLLTPELVVQARPHVGSSLTGPLAAAPRAVSDVALGVRERALWIEFPVATSGTIDPHVALVLGPGDADPLRPVARRASGVGFARGAEAVELVRAIESGKHGRTKVAWEESERLEPGTTFRVDAATKAEAEDRVSLLLDASRASEAAEARIALQIGRRGESEREKLVLADALRPGDGPIAFVFARTVVRDQPAAFVVLLEITDGAGMAAAPSVGVEASVAAAAERSREITRSEEEQLEIRGVLADLDAPSERRARLVFLTSSCGTPLALDVALIAQDADLAELAEAVRAAIPDSADRAKAAWPIERAAWLLLARKAAAGAIAPELSGVLARQGGDAARFPGAIEDLVRGVDSVAGLAQRLAAENRILLEDASPSSRMRAYDWLAARGLAPEGFDPLGTLAERRAALRKLADAEEAAARTNGKSP